jgi:hypothetical protein
MVAETKADEMLTHFEGCTPSRHEVTKIYLFLLCHMLTEIKPSNPTPTTRILERLRN